jgi:hypothetical protein
MSSADRRRAHVRVGAATIGVFLLFLVVGATHRSANASSNSSPAPSTNEQSTPGPPGQFPPYGRRGRFGPDGGDGFQQ